ncbi:cupin domain-containing protein [Microbacterium sp. B2969]|uniref:Cupin domain-containing protein n=1 Tax=Microbacterium alkaliflavum TaxID=3248839 RepID=A0ABW7Q3A5_9MICO
MKVESERQTIKNPPEWFTGDVWLDLVASPQDPGQRMSVGVVRFAPCARTAWHSHPGGQTLLVTEGVALVQARGGEVIEVHPGQTVYTPPGEEHWHGAAPDRFMTHIAMYETPDGESSADWGAHVTDEEYGRGPTVTSR